MIKRMLICAVALAGSSVSAVADDLPDLSLTPGVVSTTNVPTICERANAKMAPLTTSEMEREVYARYGLRDNHSGYCAGSQGCKIDHLIPIELGGAGDIENLWPQSYDSVWGVKQKEKLAERLRKLVCTGQLGIQRAQLDISTDWIAAYRDYIRQ